MRYFGPVLAALHELGGSARPAEVREVIVRDLAISEEEQADLMSSGNPRFDNQVAWARFYLAKAGLIDSSRRGVWALSDSGRSAHPMSFDQALELFRTIQATFPRSPSQRLSDESEDEAAPESAETETPNHRQQDIE